MTSSHREDHKITRYTCVSPHFALTLSGMTSTQKGIFPSSSQPRLTPLGCTGYPLLLTILTSIFIENDFCLISDETDVVARSMSLMISFLVVMDKLAMHENVFTTRFMVPSAFDTPVGKAGMNIEKGSPAFYCLFRASFTYMLRPLV